MSDPLRAYIDARGMGIPASREEQAHTRDLYNALPDEDSDRINRLIAAVVGPEVARADELEAERDELRATLANAIAPESLAVLGIIRELGAVVLSDCYGLVEYPDEDAAPLDRTIAAMRAADRARVTT